MHRSRYEESPQERRLQGLEVIVKVTERCNINCRYCYFFNGSDDSFRHQPAVISTETAHAIASFLREGSEVLGLKAIRIIFHGGEPLLLGKRRLDEFCKVLAQTLTPVVSLTLSMQTNATLIDAEWIDIFRRHDVRVGVSLDGPPEYNDLDRVDFRGRGTHDDTVRGLRLLQGAVANGSIKGAGILCVINPRHSARRIYRYFVDDLHVKHMDFLLPDLTHDTLEGQPEAYGAFLCELFNTWVSDDDPSINVRTLTAIMSLMLGGPSWVEGFGREAAPAVTIRGDGSLQPTDVLRACGPEMMATGATVTSTTLKEFLQSTVLQRLQGEYEDVCRQCRRCCWLEVCGGGSMVHRYRKINRFDNPSVLCGGLKNFYAEVGAYLVTRGLPVERLRHVLAL